MFDTRNIPILLTSSVIAHDTGVNLLDPHARAQHAIESVRYWRKFAPSNPLVLCDGSGFDFTPLVAKLSFGKMIECISFQNNSSLVQQHGRGYGEGEIIKFALKNSKFILSNSSFVKCSSKLWVENFSECMKQWNGKALFKGVFNHTFSLGKVTQFSYIDTRFYAINIETYEQSFIHAHENIKKTMGHGLEECFADIYINQSHPAYLMHTPPVICGVGGGIGKYYKNTFLRGSKERLRYRFLKHHPIFKSWFS
jgi:hypothetical protein